MRDGRRAAAVAASAFYGEPSRGIRLVGVTGTNGTTTTVGGTVGGGEPRFTRLNDYRLDMAPTQFMLVTHHTDRPGLVGRIGLILGEADVNIGAMHLARSGPRQDALMILALDDEVPDAIVESIRSSDGVVELWSIRLGAER